jgi:hypothetical protein
MKIIVRDNLGKDVTYEREWYINTDGKIFYYIGDIDCPLYFVDNDYTFEVVSEGCSSVVTEEYLINKYPFVISKDVLENLPRAEASRIEAAIDNIAKYKKKVW